MTTLPSTAGLPVLKMEGIAKSFSGVAGLDDMRLEVACGKAHALMGEMNNGLRLPNVLFYWQSVVQGLLIARAVPLDQKSK